MKSWLFFAGVAACAFACGCCRKQEGAACQPSAGEKPGAEQQMAVATDDAFAAVDKNADGKLSKDEYFAIWKTADVVLRRLNF